MNNRYSDFLKEKIVSDEYNKVAWFQEDSDGLFIVSPDVRIKFDARYSDELYDILLIAARQLLDLFYRDKELDDLIIEARKRM